MSTELNLRRRNVPQPKASSTLATIVGVYIIYVVIESPEMAPICRRDYSQLNSVDEPLSSC